MRCGAPVMKMSGGALNDVNVTEEGNSVGRIEKVDEKINMYNVREGVLEKRLGREGATLACYEDPKEED
jgi:hypothetical protein